MQLPPNGLFSQFSEELCRAYLSSALKGSLVRRGRYITHRHRGDSLSVLAAPGALQTCPASVRKSLAAPLQPSARVPNMGLVPFFSLPALTYACHEIGNDYLYRHCF